MMNEILQTDKVPELVFGIIAPIGVDIDMVCGQLSTILKDMRYISETFRITDLMKEISNSAGAISVGHIAKYKHNIETANSLRKKYGANCLAALSIGAIRNHRVRYWSEQIPTKNIQIEPRKTNVEENKNPSDSHANIPIPNQAYIIRQLKRPEEIQLFRQVYGRQFIAISAYSPEASRVEKIQQAESKAKGGLINSSSVLTDAILLVSQDSKENGENIGKSGQNVRDAFPLGDVFIDASTTKECKRTLERFIQLLFGHNQITPNHDEYGMYLAKSASLRSSDLSRQVGAAIFSNSGEVSALGCNEVPKAGGGTYWPEDPSDKRDFVQGYDPNDEQKNELFIDLIERLRKNGHLSAELSQKTDPIEITRKLLEDKTENGLGDSRLMDILEFGRIIHAEMSAISDAARNGISIKGNTLYCTTFPCHICAKHIVAAGIMKVVYLEPYPKSYATKLHSDSIEIEGDKESKKVIFRPFIGISPFRYRDLFEKGKRKYGGKAQEWTDDNRRPFVEVYFPSYFRSEALVVKELFTRINQAN